VPCQICIHPNRVDIEKAQLTGEANTRIGRRLRVSVDALDRHKTRGHISQTIAKSHAAVEALRGEDLQAQLRALSAQALSILAEARQTRQHQAALAAIDKMTKIIEIIAKLTGQLDESARVNILVQQQAAAAAEQDLMLDRLTVLELAELRRLVAKAQGEPSAPGNGVSGPAEGFVGVDVVNGESQSQS
jgi:hypothetical protein